MAENEFLIIKVAISATGDHDYKLPPGIFLAQLVAANWTGITAGLKVSLSGDSDHFADVTQPPGHTASIAPTANMEPVGIQGAAVIRVSVDAIDAVPLYLLVSRSV